MYSLSVFSSMRDQHCEQPALMRSFPTCQNHTALVPLYLGLAEDSVVWYLYDTLLGSEYMQGYGTTGTCITEIRQQSKIIHKFQAHETFTNTRVMFDYWNR